MGTWLDSEQAHQSLLGASFKCAITCLARRFLIYQVGRFNPKLMRPSEDRGHAMLCLLHSMRAYTRQVTPQLCHLNHCTHTLAVSAKQEERTPEAVYTAGLHFHLCQMMGQCVLPNEVANMNGLASIKASSLC